MSSTNSGFFPNTFEAFKDKIQPIPLSQIGGLHFKVAVFDFSFFKTVSVPSEGQMKELQSLKDSINKGLGRHLDDKSYLQAISINPFFIVDIGSTRSYKILSKLCSLFPLAISIPRYRWFLKANASGVALAHSAKQSLEKAGVDPSDYFCDCIVVPACELTKATYLTIDSTYQQYINLQLGEKR